MDDNVVYLPGVLERAMKEMEGQSVPLKDRPGGRVIGTVMVVDGEFAFTVEDPEMRALLSAPTREVYKGYSLQGPTTKQSAAEEWNDFLDDAKKRFRS